MEANLRQSFGKNLKDPPSALDLAPRYISVRGAREHNLKNIDVDLPRDAFVVITGVSGSGKSSLAFDTIYAEGQRRYMESLSAYARQFLEQFQKPDCDLIEGLSPAISIEQNLGSRNPRSTVGTVTEIYDFLRLMYARLGTPFCPDCNIAITSFSLPTMLDRILAFPNDTKAHILSPIIRGRKGIYTEEFEGLRKEGFSRVRVDGVFYELSEDIRLERQKKHTIEVVIDRLKLGKAAVADRLQEAVELAIRLSGGFARVELVRPTEPNEKVEILDFNQSFSCAQCGLGFPELEPRLFSFNSTYGACKDCQGLGYRLELDPALFISDGKKSFGDCFMEESQNRHKDYFHQVYLGLCKQKKIKPETPFEDLPKSFQQILFNGSAGQPVTFLYKKGRVEKTIKKAFEGIVPYFQSLREEESDVDEWFLENYLVERPCATCRGMRLRKESLAVKIQDKSISDLVNLSLEKAFEFITNLDFAGQQQKIAQGILKEIKERLGFLLNVGLDYLSLDRRMATLSGGEMQRIRLASQIGSQLVGVLYVLDEPSIGLHPRDNQKLLRSLFALRDLGNSILVVEHDEETMRAADFLVDIGPGAGRNGGHLMAAGTPKEVEENPNSITGRYLTGKEKIEVPAQRRSPRDFLKIQGAKAHNLKNIDVEIPLGVFTCITGVSGSGKSSLIIDTLYEWFRHRLLGREWRPDFVGDILGANAIDKIINIDQNPIGRTPRSNPATYTGVFSLIRELFAALPEAKSRGWKAGRFSFNIEGGRCEHCQGGGTRKIEMHFMPDVNVVCEVCEGRRYQMETLEVKFRGSSIAEVLHMSIDEALEFFTHQPMIKNKLRVLSEVGLGYLSLGQSATTLSGGESQRMKLARELSKRATGKTLFILDEPTTGLHLADIKILLEIFSRLVDQGNTVIVIEHQLDVIKSADYIIDLGPEGGERGGEILAAGSPEALLKSHPHTPTLSVLKTHLSQRVS